MHNSSDARTGSIPPASRLEAAVLRLGSEGDRRTLVSMVERWSQVGDPTPAAMLAQIRALLDLCMMDRAWTRLQALPEDPAFRRDRLILTARMFRERGWPRRAAKVLEEARQLWPEDAEIQHLIATTPASAPVLAHEANPEAGYGDQIALVEGWLCSGAFLKARRELEAMKRRFPQESRPLDLLWALRGDYELQGTSLQALVRRLAPAPMAFTEPAPTEDVRDPTDTIPDDQYDHLGLFGAFDLPTVDAADDDAEVTQATRLADLQDSEAPPHDHDEDTQVLRIVQSDLLHRSPTPPRAPSKETPGMAPRYTTVSRTGEAPLPEPATSPGIADELEGEDEAVVLLTRQAERQPPHRTVAPPSTPDLGPRRRPDLEPPPRPDVQRESSLPDVALAADLPPWVIFAAAGLAGASGMFALLAAWSAGLFG